MLGLSASLLLVLASASAATDTTHKAPDLQLFIAGYSAREDGTDINSGGSVAELVERADHACRVLAGVGSSDVNACLDAPETRIRWAIGMFQAEVPRNSASREFQHARLHRSLV